MEGQVNIVLVNFRFPFVLAARKHICIETERETWGQTLEGYYYFQYL